MNGCLRLLLFPLVFPIKLTWAVLMLPFRALAWLGAALSPRCGVCSALIAKKSYMWTVRGKPVKACPSCNRRLNNELSKEGVRELVSLVK